MAGTSIGELSLAAIASSILTGLSVGLIARHAVAVIQGKRSDGSVRDRIASSVAVGRATSVSQDTQAADQILAPLRQGAAVVIDRVGARDGAAHLLSRAGVSGTVEDWSLLAVAGALLASGVGALAGGGLFALAATLAVPLLLVWFLRAAAARRRERLRSQIPFFFEAVASAVGSGKSLRQALEMAASAATAPLAGQLGTLKMDLALGRPVRASLSSFAEQVGLEELEPIMHGLSLQHSVGGNEKQFLMSAARLLRQEASARDSLGAKTAQARMSVKLVAAAPVVLLAIMAVAAPDYLEVFYATQSGRTLFVAAVVLDVLGVIMVRKMLRVHL